jgi:regulator of nucleoside diphosphate kinase
MILNDKDYNRIIEQIKRSRINAIAGTNIKVLAGGLKEAKVIHTNQTPPNLITMNSKVLIRRMDNNQYIEMSVVYHDNADSKHKKISVFAPIGIAMLGSKESETVNCQLPNGNVHYKICKVLYQPEAAGDHHL